MNRRLLLRNAAMFGLGQMALSAGAESASAHSPGEATRKPIVLYCDLAIDPRREQEMLDHFHKDFKPAAEKFAGYMDVKIVKFRKVIQGRPAPANGIDYRFQLTYKNEELRQKWIASSVHQHVWPLIEATVLNKDYLVLLTDSV